MRRSEPLPALSWIVLSWIASLVGGALLLCGAALINGGPIFFPDTGSYIIDGDRLVHLAAPLNVRPVFYGVAIWLLHWDHTLWPVLFAQGLIVTHLIWLTMRAAGVALGPWSLLATMAGLAALTPLSWYTSHVLPDVFTGVVILSVFLLGFCRQRLTRLETSYVFVLAAAAISFHLSHLPIAVAIGIGSCVVWAIWPDLRMMLRPLLAIGPTLLALLVSVSFSLALYHRVTLAANSPPFLMARLIADGPGLAYLHQTCPARHFTICNDLDSLPTNSNGILWGWLPYVPTQDGKQIRAEAGEIALGTIEMFPLRVLQTALSNTVQQLVSIDASVEPQDADRHASGAPFYAAEIDRTLQARGALGELLAGFNAVHALVALGSLFACLVLAWACLARQVYRPALLIGVIMVGLAVNAFASGALGGVFARYQGRIIWLLPFGALTAGLAVARLRAPALVAAVHNK